MMGVLTNLFMNYFLKNLLPFLPSEGTKVRGENHNTIWLPVSSTVEKNPARFESSKMNPGFINY